LFIVGRGNSLDSVTMNVGGLTRRRTVSHLFL
jgi:hypothetical protein